MTSITAIVIKTAAFLLGMGLSVQLLASLYGIVDLWYTIRTAYPRVIKGIVIWSFATAVIGGLLGDAYRSAFFWGMGALVVFQGGVFLGMKLLVIRNARILERETSIE